jgi:GntR family transcriptional repressor for pyruvate dehydrogenase complex
MAVRTYRQVADSIAQKIYGGKFKVGDKLPTERELSAQYKLGRPVIREALIALELYGMVTIRQGAGIFVLPWQAQSLKVNIFDRGVSPFELIDARRMIECECAAAAAVIITDRELLNLQRSLQGMKESHEDLAAHVVHDQEFHTAIARAARNSALASIVECLWALHLSGRHSPHIGHYMPRDKLHGDRYDEHLAIYRALERHDPDGARAAMDNHLKRAKATLMDAAERMRADRSNAKRS